ncbi:MAG: lysis system i-spanin subunit Rz [Aeromonadaceae bacterium]
MPPIKSILTACALLASFAGGYWLADNGWQKKASKEREEVAAYIAQLSEQHRKKEHELSKNAEALDQKYTADLSAAERRIDELSADLAAGPKRVFVRAKCPSSSAETSTSGSVGDGGAAELGQAAREDYLRLKRGIAKQDAQIRYLQDYVKQQCLSPQ